MDAKKTNISQIDQYLKGQLDAKAMNKLERQAQDDPFLLDALEGLEKAGTDQHANLAELEARLANRVAKKETRSILLWRVLPMAACLLLMLGGGYWFVSRQPQKVQHGDNISTAAKPEVDKAPWTGEERPADVADTAPSRVAKATTASNKHQAKYLAPNNPLKSNGTVNDIVKKMEAVEVDSAGIINKGASGIIAARLNGKSFSGGNTDEALKNLPADIREKIQIIDDYGDVSKKETVGLYGNKAPVAGIKPSYKIGSFGSLVNPPRVGPAPLPPGKVVITGTVLDAVSKEPLTGTIIGTQKDGSITQADINGNYAVTVDKGSVLTYNFVTYAPQSHKLSPAENAVNINMTTDTKQASEVVIRGYVKRNRPDNGSYTTVISKGAQDNPIANVEQLLQGKVAGLNIQNNTGAPGMRGSVNIRGLSTPYAVTDSTKQPYFVNAKVFYDDGKPANAVSLSLGGKFINKADDKGIYQLLCIGPVVLSVSAPGYVTQHVTVHNADTATVVIRKSRINQCDENPEFKTLFYAKIDTAERYTSGYFKNVTDAQFTAAIKFIARYTKVAIGTRPTARYKDLDAFMVDKAKWLNWYETKKCKGIKRP